jgi:hypothetical protein
MAGQYALKLAARIVEDTFALRIIFSRTAAIAGPQPDFFLDLILILILCLRCVGRS